MRTGKNRMVLVVKKFYENVYLLAFEIHDTVVVFVLGIFLGNHIYSMFPLLSSTSVLDDIS